MTRGASASKASSHSLHLASVGHPASVRMMGSANASRACRSSIFLLTWSSLAESGSVRDNSFS